MSNHSRRMSPEAVARRKKWPKWLRTLYRYWPPIRFCLVCLLIVGLIVWGVVSAVNSAQEKKAAEEAEAQRIADELAYQEELKVQSAALLEEAERIAAGYDYIGASELLKQSIYYEDSPEMQEAVGEYSMLDAELISYPNMESITHIFFHSLIVDTERCFDGDGEEAGYNQNMATIAEFNAVLESLYEKGYVLVSPYDIAYEVTDETGTHFEWGNIRLPKGKTPILLSQDDVNYYGYMLGDHDDEYSRPAQPTPEGDGFAHKIMLDENGELTCEYMDANGNITTGDYDMVPLVESFIEEHPDFSYHGAKGILVMTGYEGVLGYRTKPEYEETLGAEAYANECKQAREVADALRANGWVLGSHSYGHLDYGEADATRVEADANRWETTVESVIGECDVLIYPFGVDIAGTEEYTTDNAKFNALYEDGFRYFFNVDSQVAFSQLGEDHYRANRRNIDGYRMYYHPELLEDLIDAEAILDPARPLPVPEM